MEASSVYSHDMDSETPRIISQTHGYRSWSTGGQTGADEDLGCEDNMGRRGGIEFPDSPTPGDLKGSR